MSHTTLADALAPLRARMPQVVREHEVLRVAAAMARDESGAIIRHARQDALAWAQRRSGGQLPPTAWNGDAFEYLAGGRTTLGTRIQVEGSDVWALRCDDPDKNVAERTWTTEVALGKVDDGEPRLSLRLLVSTPEEVLSVEPHTPGLVQQIAGTCGLQVGGTPLSPTAWRVGSTEDADKLIELIESPRRTLPLLVATGDERAPDPDAALVDVDALARATLGLALVVNLPAAHTYALSDAFGKLRSVYHGAVRVYMPRFDSSSNPYDHRLFLADRIRSDTAHCVGELRRLAAAESVRRTRLGHDVLPFALVRSAASAEAQRISAQASIAEQLAVARKRIEALEDALKEARTEAEQYFELAQQEEQRASAAEAQYEGAASHIHQLRTTLEQRGQKVDEGIRLPASWREFPDWCDQHLSGRLSLSPAARNGVKKPMFEDAALAAQCMVWLAGECRDKRMAGGGALANIHIGNGLQNAPCGADAYEFEFRGRRLAADWHVKNGGNTRDPARCLRIYYAWDDTTRQIVVASLPAHRRTGAT